MVLASSSPFRKALLKTLGLAFETYSPDIDETPLEHEDPKELVLRLAAAKAHKVAAVYPNAIIIASDQVAVCEGKILGKPGNHENALKQLSLFQGKRVSFFTSLTVLNSETKEQESDIDEVEVTFRTRSQKELEHYIKQEQPFNCAGSFKCEGLGISLFEKIESSDPNSLIGLPLIKLTTMLEHAGVSYLHFRSSHE
ncbi:septum formation inhibitor Maf [Lysobacter sp. N42]|nr:septum formation inhibitor Maf [Aliidiomarina sp. B3213]TCZ93430.1 septum formation inhibitor Maf [Lysobacter sp. N42]